MPNVSKPGRGERVATPIISKIDIADIALPAASPDFAAFAKQQLGDLGTGKDGFDALFSPAASAIDGDIAALSSFDADLTNASFTTGAFAKTYHAPVEADITSLLQDGDQLNHAVQNPGQITSDPIVTPPPSPPTAGGGSGGSSGGSGSSGAGSSGGIQQGGNVLGGQTEQPPSDLPGWDIPDPAGNTPIDFPGDGTGTGGIDNPPIIVIPPHPVVL